MTHEKTLEILKEIYRTADISPIFRPNPLFAGVMDEDSAAYIALDDVLGYRYIVRLMPEGGATSFPITEYGTIIAEYNSLEELLNDGWQLD